LSEGMLRSLRSRVVRIAVDSASWREGNTDLGLAGSWWSLATTVIRELLAAEPGVDPRSALRSLKKDILAREPHLSAPANGPGVPVRDVPVNRGPYVGRDAELAQALGAAAEAAPERH
jgi:hypothetical protein